MIGESAEFEKQPRVSPFLPGGREREDRNHERVHNQKARGGLPNRAGRRALRSGHRSPAFHNEEAIVPPPELLLGLLLITPINPGPTLTPARVMAVATIFAVAFAHRLRGRSLLRKIVLTFAFPLLFIPRWDFIAWRRLAGKIVLTFAFPLGAVPFVATIAVDSHVIPPSSQKG
ncbi:MAG: hypothetical protein M5U01_25195 [Ardenticatenaceae bacterium]|nr:hypothetical protein [Ardenticatenaceae bacterium]HBY93500.1 hypothetical protein [Chloroflexota bacterium]